MTAIERVKGVFDPRWTADGVHSGHIRYRALDEGFSDVVSGTVGIKRRREGKRREEKRRETSRKEEKGGEEREAGIK